MTVKPEQHLATSVIIKFFCHRYGILFAKGKNGNFHTLLVSSAYYTKNIYFFYSRQLLLDCGIGTNEDVSVNQHRALIFCQLKAMLDIVENDLLKKHLPAVSYLRLDGSVPPSFRHQIVTKFNGDPSIDVLLLTTQVSAFLQ